MLRAPVRHRHRSGGEFLVFVAHAGVLDEQPGPEGARGQGEIDRQADSFTGGDDRGRTGYASPDNIRAVHGGPDNARGSAGQIVRASPDNGGARTASFFSGAG